MSGKVIQVPAHDLIEAGIGKHYWEVRKSSIVNPEVVEVLEKFVRTKRKFLSGGFGYTLYASSDVSTLKECEYLFAIMAKICVAIGKSVYFMSELEFMDLYAATFSNDADTIALLKKITNVDALFIHSLTGNDHKKFSAEAMSKLLKNRRDNRRSTFIATSLKESDFKNLYSSRAWDFLTELSPTLNMVEAL